MKDASRNPEPKRTLAATVSALLALLTLVGGGALAASFEGVPRILAGLATLTAYILLSNQVLRRLSVDWDAWRAPDPELPGRNGRQGTKPHPSSHSPLLAGIALVLAALAPALRAEEAAPAPTPAPTPTPAPNVPDPTPAAKPWYEGIAVNGFVSASYSYNTNRPASSTNQLRVFDFDDNSIKIDVAEVVLQKAVAKPGDVGFRIDAVAGSSIPRISAASGLFRDASGKAQDFDLQQAFVSYVAPVGGGLRFDAGKFVSPLGYEVIDGYDGFNDNATRSFLFGYAIPFTHTGIKASYTITDQVAGMVMLVNGWDNVKDNNRGKSYGAQLVWTPTKTVTVAVNYLGGPERTDTNRDARNVVNVNAQWKVTDRVVLALDSVWGSEPNAVVPDRTAVWGGVVGYARFGVSDSFALILRGELFDDRDGARTGVAQKPSAVTLTPELKLSTHLVLRGDLRIDFSNKEVFEDHGGALTKKQQPTVLLNALYAF